MYFDNPELSFQLARERHNEMIDNHLKRQALRTASGISPLVAILLERAGDALVSWGSAMRRRARRARTATADHGDLLVA